MANMTRLIIDQLKGQTEVEFSNWTHLCEKLWKNVKCVRRHGRECPLCHQDAWVSDDEAFVNVRWWANEFKGMLEEYHN